MMLLWWGRCWWCLFGDAAMVLVTVLVAVAGVLFWGCSQGAGVVAAVGACLAMRQGGVVVAVGACLAMRQGGVVVVAVGTWLAMRQGAGQAVVVCHAIWGACCCHSNLHSSDLAPIMWANDPSQENRSDYIHYS